MLSESVSTVNGDEECEVCEKSFDWHQENQPRHPFTPRGGSKAFLGARRDRDPQSGRKTAQPGSQAPSTVVWPTDPVLRIALIQRGVITADDLRSAEDMLRASMGLGEGGGNGQPSAETRGRKVQVGETTSLHVGDSSLCGEEVGTQPEH